MWTSISQYSLFRGLIFEPPNRPSLMSVLKKWNMGAPEVRPKESVNTLECSMTMLNLNVIRCRQQDGHGNKREQSQRTMFW